MSLFIRILRYADRLNSRCFWLVVFSFLGVAFGAFNVLMVIPMLNVLFNKVDNQVAAKPDFTFSSDYPVDLFNHYFQLIINTYGRLDALLFVCIIILVFVFLANVFRFFEYVIVIKIKTDLVKNLRLALFDKFSKLHIGFFHSHKKGDLLARFTHDIYEVESNFVMSAKSLLREPITILVYFSILFSLSLRLTLFTILFLPITGSLIAQIIKRLKSQTVQQQQSLGRLLNIIEETFGGMRVVKAFNAETFVSKKMREESNRYRRVNRLTSYKNELASPVSEILGTVTVVVIVFFGGSMVLANQPQLTPNVLLGFLALFAMLIQPVKSLSNAITNIEKSKVSAKRIFEFMELEAAICNKPSAVTLERFEKSIEFRKVSFAYEVDLVLNKVDLSIEKGKTIALIGASGGGKSTIADLIPRFYDPTSGEIRIDGRALTEYKVESVRKLIGVVAQEPILFHDTVFSNIAFGLPNANREQVIQAAKVANAHDFIMHMQQGYDTVIGERGAKLSGGQKQRLSIARAVLKNPPILILDEATSALDTASEKLVQEALFSLMKNRTSLVIAHRLSTIKNADEIAVVQHGQIVERGTHDQLLQLNGAYKKFINLQNTTS